MSTRPCEHCGHLVALSAERCPSCGGEVNALVRASAAALTKLVMWGVALLALAIAWRCL